MKISKAQKLINREKIIAATVELVTSKGIKSATMREIARSAGLGDATIYNYFPTKEAILYGYYEDKFDQVTKKLKEIEDFNEYSFQEQLQTFFETKLEILLADREFLEKTFKTTFFALSQHYSRIRPIKDKFPMFKFLDDSAKKYPNNTFTVFNGATKTYAQVKDTSDREFLEKTFKTTFFALSQHYSRIRPIKDKFMAIIEDIFEAAIEVGEIPDQVFRELTIQFFWEYYIGMVIYWLKDDSDQFKSTTILIDKTIDLACTTIRTGIGNKLFDMGIFLFKNHVLSRMDFIKDQVDTIHGIKKKFMEEKNA